MNKVPIVSVTGTKGKTTTVAVIADVLQKLGKNVLKVDTTGHFVNSQRRSSLEDSKETWGLVPSVGPGRYLYEFLLNPALRHNGVAVLEAALGSSAPLKGLGYRYHDIGIFLNVFEDHIGSSSRIQSKQDIADAKDFVFRKITKDGGGFAIFNADDPLVTDKLTLLDQGTSITLIPVGFTFSDFDLESHLSSGGFCITSQDKQVILKSKDTETVVCDLDEVPWTFKGNFLPSVWNMMFATAGVIACNNGNVPEGLREALESVRLDKNGGRLTVLKAKSGTTIVADYAHEKESLSQIGELARTLVQDEGKTIGVVRLAPDRTDELISETGAVIGESFDEIVVFDKIDGYWRKPRDKKMRFKEVVGHVSEVLTKSALRVNPNVSRILREDEALQYAAKIAGPKDVVVTIVNDDIKRSLDFIQDAFEAEFI